MPIAPSTSTQRTAFRVAPVAFIALASLGYVAGSREPTPLMRLAKTVAGVWGGLCVAMALRAYGRGERSTQYVLGAMSSLSVVWVASWAVAGSDVSATNTESNGRTLLRFALMAAALFGSVGIARRYFGWVRYHRTDRPLDRGQASAVLRLPGDDGGDRFCPVWLLGQDQTNSAPIIVFGHPKNEHSLADVPDAVEERFPGIERGSAIWVLYDHADGMDYFMRMDYTRSDQAPKAIWDVQLYRKIEAAAVGPDRLPRRGKHVQ